MQFCLNKSKIPWYVCKQNWHQIVRIYGKSKLVIMGNSGQHDNLFLNIIYYNKNGKRHNAKKRRKKICSV